jgi:hypothetical protein
LWWFGFTSVLTIPGSRNEDRRGINEDEGWQMTEMLRTFGLAVAFRLTPPTHAEAKLPEGNTGVTSVLRPFTVWAYLQVGSGGFPHEPVKVCVQTAVGGFPFGDWEANREAQGKIFKALLKAWLLEEE